MNEVEQTIDESKVVLLIGELADESITTKIRSLGYRYIQKRLLNSRPENWVVTSQLMLDLYSSGKLIAVLFNLSENTILNCIKDTYKESWRILFDAFIHVKDRLLVFIYEDNLEEKFSSYKHELLVMELVKDRLKTGAGIWEKNEQEIWEKFDRQYIDRLETLEEERNEASNLVKELNSSGLTFVPYRKKIELIMRIQEYLEELDKGILFRLYVPKNRYQEEQLASFLRIFETYLRKVERRPFSINSLKTNNGSVYIFSSKEFTQLDELDTAIFRFEEFMEVCQNEVDYAMSILRTYSIADQDAENLIANFVRDYKRLRVDIRHEFERKLLLLKHKLENEMIEGNFKNIELELTSQKPSSLLSLSNIGILNVNLYDSNFQNFHLQEEIQQIFTGDITYNSEEIQMIRLFEDYADRLEAVQLKSALDELKDTSSEKQVRQTGKQKILNFLYKIAPIIGEGMVKGLIEYVQKQMTGL